MTIIDFSEKGRRRLLWELLFLAACFVALALTVSGWTAPLWTVAMALLTGLAANCVAVALGLVMLDRYSEERRHAQWNPVRTNVALSIDFYLWQIGNNVLMIFGVKDQAVKELLDLGAHMLDVPRGLKELSDRFPHYKDGSFEQPSGQQAIEATYEKCMDFVKVNSPWFRLIHDALPLIIQADAGVALVHAVQEFSQAVERIEAAEAARSSFKVEREHWQPTLAGLIGRLLAKGSELSESARHEYPETPETTS